MNRQVSLKHLFSRINIPNSPINKIFSEYKRKETIPNQNQNLYSSFYRNELTFNEKEVHKTDTFSSKSNKKNKILLKYNSKLKKGKTNLFLYKSKNKCSTNNTTQTPSIMPNQKKSKLILLSNSLRNKYRPLNIRKKYLLKDKFMLGSYNKHKTNNNNNRNDIFDINKNIKYNKNNICINSNINKTISNVVVDNNIDLLREIKFQTVNNFNNKYRLKYKTKFPNKLNKVNDLFSLLRLHKYEEEKKINEIITLTNEKRKNILKRRKINQKLLFNEKDFEKNFSLMEKDFDIKNKLKDNKKFVSIHTLDLLKK